MRVKLFRAPTVAGAMARVRAELGHDALILGTRRVSEGVEVTAALEPQPVAAPAPPRIDGALVKRLAWHGTPPGLAGRLAGGALEATLGQVLRFGPPRWTDERPVIFSGPPGSGKTLTVARLATRFVLAGERPMVITADCHRAGAVEQLASLIHLLGLELLVAEDPVMLARHLARRRAGIPVLIDASGSNPFDPADRDQHALLAATADARNALVLSAGLAAEEAADIAALAASDGADTLIATQLDVKRRIGGILAAAQAGRLALAEAGIGPGVADGLVPFTPALLAERLMRPATLTEPIP